MSIEHDFSSGVSTGVTVGATTTAILTANEARKYAVFVNDSTEEIYVSLGADAVMNKGIRLNRRGGTFTIGGEKPFRGAINGICTSGSKVMCVLEA